MNLDSTLFDIMDNLQRDASVLGYNNHWLPTPIGPQAKLEVVPSVSASSLLTAMDQTTTSFIKETFTRSLPKEEDPLLAWDLLATHDNIEKISRLPLGSADSGMVDRTPDMVRSKKQLMMDRHTVFLYDDYSGSSKSVDTSSKKCLWPEKYDELVQYKRRFGHCQVPNNYNENVKLSQWVKRQRHQYKLKKEGKNSSLTDDKIIALESLGFVWSVQEDTWEERFQELQAYKDVHGHANVPKNCKDHPQLSVWVKYQRRHLRLYSSGQRSSMTKDRFYRLNELGFQWNPRKRKEDGESFTAY